MIILPGTPVIPSTINGSSFKLDGSLSSTRSSIGVTRLDNYSSLVKAALGLEEYIEQITRLLQKDDQQRPLEECLEQASNISVCKAKLQPWKGVHIDEEKSRKRKVILKGMKSEDLLEWSMLNELELSVADLVFMYMRIGSDLTKELIETERETLSTEQADEKWKRVVNFYKKCLAIATFGVRISQIKCSQETRLAPVLFIFLEKMSEICIQISLLSKTSWVNRDTMNRFDSFNTTNNGTLARVGIYILDELKNAEALLVELETSSIKFAFASWQEYMKVVKKYIVAYIGFFLAIGKYQQDKIGEAIGLVNFSLLNLNSKKLNDSDVGDNKFKQFRQKIGSRKNESFIRNLQSVTTLNLESSIFKERPGIILTDIEYLFDSLISLRLKFIKENDNIKFQEIIKYDDIESDSKWPLGCKVPMKGVECFNPFLRSSSSDNILNKERDNYF